MNEKNILLIEDNEGDAGIINRLLKKAKYLHTLSWVKTFSEALIKLENNKFDIILTDLSLPDMDGLSVVKEISAIITDIPIVVLTGNSDEETSFKAIEVGAHDYLLKDNINEYSLIHSIRYAIDRNSILHEKIKLASKLNEANQHIIELEQKNTALAMGVTANHELNQPLAVLKGNLGMLKLLITPDEKKEFEKVIIKIDKSVNSIASIIKRYSDFDTIEFKDYIEGTKMLILKNKDSK